MSTDPFDGVKTKSNEIGLTTFVELIYTEIKTQKERNTRTTEQSLLRLAHNKRNPENSRDPSHVGNEILSPKYRYTINQSSQDQNLTIQSEFNSLVKNSISCATTTINKCSSHGSAIDIVFAIDTSPFMANTISNFKKEFTNTANELSLITENIRISVVGINNDLKITTQLDGCDKPKTEDINGLTTDNIATDLTNSIQSIIDGTAGLWRTDTSKIIVILTNNESTISKTISTNAASCGINIIIVNVGVKKTRNESLAIAHETNGKYVETNGVNTLAYIYSFCREICDPIIDQVNIVNNGHFNLDISGWDIDGIAEHATIGTNGFAILKSGTITQTITDLTPGSVVYLNVTIAGTANSGSVYVGLNDSGATQPVSGGLNIFNGAIITRSAIVPPSGTMTVIIENSTTLPSPIYVDNVILYQIKNESCGFGSLNLISNSDFSHGVDGWYDENGDELTNDSWANQSSLRVAPYAKYTITNIDGEDYINFSFDLIENAPSSNDNLRLLWGLVDSDDNTIDSGVIINNLVTFPVKVSRSIKLPSNFEGPLHVEFVSDGEAIIDNVYCCHAGGYFDDSLSKISYDEFNIRNGWAGGSLLDNSINLDEATNDSILQQTYFEIDNNSILKISINCLTVGGIIVEFIYAGNCVIDQFFSDDTTGIKAFTSLVPNNSDRVTIRIKPKSNTITLNNILLCSKIPTNCVNSITNLRTYVKWNGVPRSPTNIFATFAKIKYRDPKNPFNISTIYRKSTSDGRWGSTTPTECNTISTIDFWKQMGESGIVQQSVTSVGLFDEVIKNIEPLTIANITNRTNWLWSIPASNKGTAQDGLVIIWDDLPDGLIESIEFFILVNSISTTEQPPKFCESEFLNAADPADTFEFIVRYTNSRNKDIEFSKVFYKSELYNDVNELPTPTWDTIAPVGYGVKGKYARWESASFVIDSVDGRGLDQCTTPLFFSTVGTGLIDLNFFKVSASGVSAPGCESTVIIDELIKGETINEVQSIILPDRTGGRWTLRFTHSGLSNIIHLPWNIPANQLRVAISNMPLIGSINNITVSGNGTTKEPYTITFVNDLGGTNLPMLKVDATGLTGTGSISVVRVQEGTLNEQQTITILTGSQLSVRIAGIGPATLALPATALQVKEALEALSPIGVGNVKVITSVSQTIPSFGPWQIQFIGDLENTNMPEMVPSNPNRVRVTTDWNGGVGTNEIQKIVVTATSGNFNLRISNPNPTGGYVITGPIPYNASAAVVTTEITAVAPWLNNSIKVKKEPHDKSNPAQIVWTVEYKGAYKSEPMDLMVGSSVDLKNTLDITEEVVRGGGTREHQRIQVIDSNFGYYRLRVKLFSTTYDTSPILWNITPEDFESLLLSITNLSPGDIRVVESTSQTPKLSTCYTITFHPRFGDVELMKVIESDLSCNPLGISNAKKPPYDFELPFCEDVEMMYSPNKTICKPMADDAIDVVESCCDQLDVIPNVYKEIVVQRDLFDPNQLGNITVKDLAVMRGLQPIKYNAYLRNFKTNILTQIPFTTLIENRMSVVLVLIDEDSNQSRNRLIKKIQSNDILKSRMVWERFTK